ncbi:hypothetical protein GPALN_009817 [Globodera pallida]|nr:hypothetical protein GPALN_009817 [Globodera pallida]
MPRHKKKPDPVYYYICVHKMNVHVDIELWAPPPPSRVSLCTNSSRVEASAVPIDVVKRMGALSPHAAASRPIHRVHCYPHSLTNRCQLSMAQPSMAQRRRFQRLPPELANEIDRLSKILALNAREEVATYETGEAARRALVTRLSLHRTRRHLRGLSFVGSWRTDMNLSTTRSISGARLPVNASAGRRPHKCEFRRRAGHVPPWPFLRWDDDDQPKPGHQLSWQSATRRRMLCLAGAMPGAFGLLPGAAVCTVAATARIRRKTIVPSIAGNADLFGISNQFIGSAAGGAQCTPSDNDQKLIRLIE